MKRRRSGTVSSIALNANSRPTSALIAANSAVDWSFGAAACMQQVAPRGPPSVTLSRSPASRSSARAHLRDPSRLRLDEHARDAARQAAEPLRVGERRERDRAVDERARARPRPSTRRDRHLRARARRSSSARDWPPRTPSARRERRRQRDRARRGGCAARRARAAARRRSRPAARRRRSGRPCGSRRSGRAASRARRPAARPRARPAAARSAAPARRRSRARSRADDLQLGASPVMPRDELLDRARDAAVRDEHREHSATPTAIPSSASSSCSGCGADPLDVEEEEVADPHRTCGTAGAAVARSSRPAGRRAGGGRGRRRPRPAGSCVTSTHADAALAADLGEQRQHLAGCAASRGCRSARRRARGAARSRARARARRGGARRARAAPRGAPRARTTPSRSSSGATRRRASRAAGALGHQLQRRVVDRRQARHEARGLEHEAELAAAVARRLAARQRREVAPVEQHAAGVGRRDAGGEQQQRRLARAARAVERDAARRPRPSARRRRPRGSSRRRGPRSACGPRAARARPATRRGRLARSRWGSRSACRAARSAA